MRGGAEQHHYRIGPLTTYVDAADLQAWFTSAAVGDKTHYAIGPSLGVGGGATVKLARALSERGEASLFLERDGGRLHYMIRKRSIAPVATSLPAPLPRLPIGPEQQLYETLAKLAADGLPLPSLEDLAELAALPDRYAARYRLQLLTTRGLVRLHGAGAARVAEIIATGARTAPSGKDRA